MRREKRRQESFYSYLYKRIPADYLWKRIAGAVDFSFINGLLSDSYCKKNGRPASYLVYPFDKAVCGLSAPGGVHGQG